MPPTPSPTYERLRHYIAERMRMSHVDQPLMLMELLGHGFARQQPAQAPRRTLPGGPWGRDVTQIEVYPNASSGWWAQSSQREAVELSNSERKPSECTP
jgi:hypothetical protein